MRNSDFFKKTGRKWRQWEERKGRMEGGRMINCCLKVSNTPTVGRGHDRAAHVSMRKSVGFTEKRYRSIPSRLRRGHARALQMA